MQMVNGVFNGTGADVYICIGFVPHFIRVWNTETAGAGYPYQIEWNIGMMRSSEIVEGLALLGPSDTDMDRTVLTKGNGILPYYGGDVLTTSNQTSTTYGEGVYLKRDDHDYRYYDGNKSPGDAVAVDIGTWTLDTAANNTGHFNEDVNGTYIGEGSMINIDGKWYSIVALTATQGEAADEVTLSHSVKSGTVHHITGKYGFKPIPVGEETPAGFLISNTSLNVNDALVAFEAGCYDGQPF